MECTEKLEKKNRATLKKHTAAIHCSNSQTLLQRKISNVLLYHAYHNLLDKEEHEISVPLLCKLIGYSGNNHPAIKQALKELISTVLEWNLTDDNTGEEEWNACSALASVKLKGPTCTYSYSKSLRELMHNPSMYGQVGIVVQARFRSSYGLALYENCARYSELKSTKWFDIEIFRKLMGVPDTKYKAFRDFKRRVLDKAVEEVNAHSDLIVSPEIHRVGRKVDKIRFSLRMRAKKKALGASSPIEPKENDIDDVKDILIKEYGVKGEVANDLLRKYGANYISQKINIVCELDIFKQGKVRSIAALLIDAIKNDYAEETSSHNLSIKLTQKRQVDIERKTKLRLEYDKYLIEEIISNFKGINEVEQNLIEQEYLDLLNKDYREKPILVGYRHSGIKSDVIKDHFVNYLRNNHKVLTKSLVSFDQYLLLNELEGVE